MGILELSPRHSDLFLSSKNNLHSLTQLIAFQLEFHLSRTWADSIFLWVGVKLDSGLDLWTGLMDWTLDSKLDWNLD